MFYSVKLTRSYTERYALQYFLEADSDMTMCEFWTRESASSCIYFFPQEFGYSEL